MTAPTADCRLPTADYCETISLNANEIAIVARRGGVATLRLPDRPRLDPIALTPSYVGVLSQSWRGALAARATAALSIETGERGWIPLDAEKVEPLIAALERALARGAA